LFANSRITTEPKVNTEQKAQSSSQNNARLEPIHDPLLDVKNPALEAV
jgi:hypothetical protein